MVRSKPSLSLKWSAAVLMAGAALAPQAGRADPVPTPLPATYYISDDPGAVEGDVSPFALAPSTVPGTTINGAPLDPNHLAGVNGHAELGLIEQPNANFVQFRNSNAHAGVISAGLSPSVGVSGQITQSPVTLSNTFNTTPTTFAHSQSVLIYNFVLTPIGDAPTNVLIPITVTTAGSATIAASTGHADATAMVALPQFAGSGTDYGTYSFDSGIDLVAAEAAAGSGTLPANALQVVASASCNDGCAQQTASFSEVFTLNVPVSTEIGIGLVTFGSAQMESGTDPNGTLPPASLSYSAFADPMFIIGDGFGDQYQIVLSANLFAAPEPISLALFGFGLAGLGLVRRRRRA